MSDVSASCAWNAWCSLACAAGDGARVPEDGLPLLARRREDGLLGDWCESAGVVTLALEGGAESR